MPAKHPHRGPRFSREVAVIYEDAAVIAVDKPAGLPAVPIPRSATASALSVVAAGLESRRQSAFVVHRIDRFTSGVLLFAKTERDRDQLVRQFLAHTPLRQYLAVLRGRLKDREGTLIHFLRRQGMFQKVTGEQNRDAARAELHYTVERELRGASLVRVTLVTGLQNQIRVQFAATGHPVIGDRKYRAAEADETRIARVALHAVGLGFVHPRTGAAIKIECPPPRDFQALVRALGQ